MPAIYLRLKLEQYKPTHIVSRYLLGRTVTYAIDNSAMEIQQALCLTVKKLIGRLQLVASTGLHRFNAYPATHHLTPTLRDNARAA